MENIKRKTNGLHIAGLVLGILSLLLSFIPILGVILAIIAIIVSAIGINRASKNNEKNGMSIAGLVTSIIGLIISIIMSILMGLGLIIFFNASSIISDSQVSTQEQAADAFNAMYENYKGEITYGGARSLIVMVDVNNNTNDRKITLEGEDVVTDADKQYNSSMFYDSEGYIYKIVISQ